MTHDLGTDQIDALQGKPDVRVISITSAERNYLAFNTGNKDNPLMNSPTSWEVARRLVDYGDITKNPLKGQYFTHRSSLLVDFPGALEEIPFTFNSAKTKEILAKIEIRNPHSMFNVGGRPPFITIMQSIQASSAQDGVKVSLLPAAEGQVCFCVHTHQHRGATHIWLPDYFDAHSNADPFAYGGGKSSTVVGLNGWRIPELNRETLAAIAKPGSTKRLDLYRKMQQKLQRSSPYAFINQGKTQIAMCDNVQGYQQGLNADMV